MNTKLQRVSGNILESPAMFRINPVNCVGVMGKGLAKGFALAYPDMLAAYKHRCSKKLFKPGDVWEWAIADGSILNMATKDHWRAPSQLSYIRTGMRNLVALLDTRVCTGIIALPLIGCGLGGLRWVDVEPLVIGAFDKSAHEYSVQIYTLIGT